MQRKTNRHTFEFLHQALQNADYVPPQLREGKSKSGTITWSLLVQCLSDPTLGLTREEINLTSILALRLWQKNAGVNIVEEHLGEITVHQDRVKEYIQAQI